ncbi:hypothetical protein QOZ80_4BG0342390 [Eleusine coracana subsp. coracana]|nr:hypothetical protein QOZ80_4BG0342390 [Eleusine coracana subsp. coracana]
MATMAQYDDKNSVCEGYRGVYCVLFVIAAVIIGFICLGVYVDHLFPTKDPVYSVAVASVSGLDPARDLSSAGDRPTLSPVLNLTVHVNNVHNSAVKACVPILSTAKVSYGDAFLAKGSVPEFCAGTRRESELVARVWGQDVVVPRFLRDQLAAKLAVGDAVVDVQVDHAEGLFFVQRCVACLQGQDWWRPFSVPGDSRTTTCKG